MLPAFLETTALLRLEKVARPFLEGVAGAAAAQALLWLRAGAAAPLALARPPAAAVIINVGKQLNKVVHAGMGVEHLLRDPI